MPRDVVERCLLAAGPGHLHPAAKVRGNGRSVRCRAFATDGLRMVLPAFGVLAGGLNVLDRAFAPLFAPEDLGLDALMAEPAGE